MTRQASSTVRCALDPNAWKSIVVRYQKPSSWKAAWQLLNSVGAYVGLWILMCLTVNISWWLTLPLAVLASGFLIRVFIIFHDCGHGSFLTSRRGNDFWGVLTGLLAFTPYHHWRKQHAIHHGTTGDLDRRGVGDVWTMTVYEYLKSSRWKRCAYRLARNPFVLLTIAPLVMFLFENRVAKSRATKRERETVAWTNLALFGMVVGMISILGFVPYVLIQLTILAITGAIGVWLFYLQHQFEDTYWQRGDDWDYVAAAMKGSAFLKLPRVLQWFTGNIGYHHIHHLSSRIPNYNLQACHESHRMFQDVSAMTILGSVKAFSLALWDEASQKLVRFAHLKRVRLAEDCR